MVCDAETGGQNQPLDNRQAISAGFPSQERGAPPLLSPGENDAKVGYLLTRHGVKSPLTSLRLQSRKFVLLLPSYEANMPN